MTNIFFNWLRHKKNDDDERKGKAFTYLIKEYTGIIFNQNTIFVIKNSN